MTDAKRQEIAEGAVRAFAREVTVLVNPTAKPSNIASGILLHREDHVSFVLTAAHCVEDGWKPANLGIQPIGETLRDAVTAVHLGPMRTDKERVDVAILALSPEVQGKLRAFGAPISCLAENDTISDDDYIVLTGFPTGLMNHDGRPVQTPTGPRLDVDVVNLYYRTASHGEDAKGRLVVEWGVGIVDGDVEPRHLKWTAGQSVSLGSPVGISGAGLWRMRTPAVGELWSPRKHGDLLGVAVSWNLRDREYVERVSAWRDWFRATVAGL